MSSNSVLHFDGTSRQAFLRSATSSTSNGSTADSSVHPFAKYTGTEADQMRRYLHEENILSGAKINSSTPHPSPDFMTTPLELVSTDPSLENGRLVPEDFLALLSQEIQKCAPIKKIYFYGGLLRSQLSNERTQKLMRELTGVLVPTELLQEPAERVPDIDVAIQVTVRSLNAFNQLRTLVNREVAKLYPRTLREDQHEQLVFKHGYHTYLCTGWESDNNQFILIRLGDGKQKNFEIKIWWNLARSNLFTVTGWQANWDYHNKTFGPLYHSDGPLPHAMRDWCTRNLRADNPKTIDHRGWARYQTLLCSNFTSDQMELEPILWNTIKNTLDAPWLILQELLRTAEVHYPNDPDFAVQALFQASLNLLIQGEHILALELWKADTWTQLIKQNHKSRFAAALYEKLTQASTELSPLWLDIGSRLLKAPSDLSKVAESFALAGFFKLGAVLKENDPLKRVELTIHRNQLYWHFTFRSRFHSTLLIAFAARLATAQGASGLFLLPSTSFVDPRLNALGLNFDGLLADNTVEMLTVRLHALAVRGQPLKREHYNEIWAILCTGRCGDLANILDKKRYPKTVQALNEQNSLPHVRAAWLSDLGGEVALQQFQQGLDDEKLTAETATAVFIEMQNSIRPREPLAYSQILLRFHALSGRLRKLVTIASEPLQETCAALLRNAASNPLFAPPSALNWYREMRGSGWLNPDQLTAILAHMLESALVHGECLELIWSEMEALKFLNAPLSPTWVELCLKLLEKSLPRNCHPVPQGQIWNLLKGSSMDASQQIRFAKCISVYRDLLAQQRRWESAYQHHANHPGTEVAHVEKGLEFLSKMQPDQFWRYAGNMCEAADRIEAAKEGVMNFFQEHLPAQLSRSPATQAQLAFVKWAGKTLLAGGSLGLAVELFNKIRLWTMDGLTENTFCKLLMPLAIRTKESCPPTTLKILTDLAALFPARMDNTFRLALLRLHLRQENIQSGWAYAMNTLGQWTLPVETEVSAALLARCTRAWESLALRPEQRWAQLQQIDALGPAAELREKVFFALIDYALAQDNVDLASRLLATRSEVDTPRHHKCVQLRIRIKNSREEVYVFLTTKDWTEWEGEWLQLAESEKKTQEARTLLTAFEQHIGAIAVSNSFKRWSTALQQLITLVASTHTEPLNTAKLLVTFRLALPTLSYRLMKEVVAGFVAAGDYSSAEAFLVVWAGNQNESDDVRRIWVEYLNAPTTTANRVEAVMEWLRANKTLFLKLNPSEEDKYLIIFKLLPLLTTDAALDVTYKNLAHLFEVVSTSPSASFNKHWLRLMNDFLIQRCAILRYQELTEVYRHLDTYFKEYPEKEYRQMIAKVYDVWILSVLAFVRSDPTHENARNLCAQALWLQEQFTGEEIPTKPRPVLELLTTMVSNPPNLQEKNLFLLLYIDEAVKDTKNIPYVIDFLLAAIQSSNADSQILALDLLEKLILYGIASGTFASALAQALLSTRANQSLAQMQAGYLLGCFIVSYAYCEPRERNFPADFHSYMNRTVLTRLVSGFDNKLVQRTTRFMKEAVDDLWKKRKLSIPLFVKFTVEQVKLVTSAADDYPLAAPQMLGHSSLLVADMIQIQPKSDVHSFNAVKAISAAFTRLDLLPMSDDLTCVIAGMYSEMMAQAAEKGVFQCNNEQYQNFFRALYGRSSAYPDLDSMEDLLPVRLEAWDALCALTSQHETNDLRWLLFNQLRNNIEAHPDHSTSQKQRAAARQIGMMNSFIKHRISLQTNFELRVIALSQALALVVRCVLDDIWVLDLNCTKLINTLLLECDTALMIKFGKKGNMSNSYVALELIAVIVEINQHVPVAESMVPRVVAILQNAGQRVIRDEPDKYLEVMERLIMKIAVEKDMLSQTQQTTLYCRLLSWDLYTGRFDQRLTHSILLTVVHTDVIEYARVFPPSKLWANLETCITQFIEANKFHPNVMERALEIANSALKNLPFTASPMLLQNLYRAMVKTARLYSHTDVQTGLTNVSRLIFSVIKSIDNSKKLDTTTVANLYNLLTDGFLNRDTEFETLFNSEPAKAREAPLTVFMIAAAIVTDIADRVDDTEFPKLMPLYYKALVDKAISFHKIAICPSLRGVIDSLINDMERRAAAGSYEEGISLTLRDDAEGLRAQVSDAFTSGLGELTSAGDLIKSLWGTKK